MNENTFTLSVYKNIGVLIGVICFSLINNTDKSYEIMLCSIFLYTITLVLLILISCCNKELKSKLLMFPIVIESIIKVILLFVFYNIDNGEMNKGYILLISIEIYVLIVIFHKFIINKYCREPRDCEEGNYTISKVCGIIKNCNLSLFKQCTTSYSKREAKKESLFVSVIHFMSRILSYDYLISGYYKYLPRNEEKRVKGKVIKKFNSCNLIISIILGLIMIILYYADENNYKVFFDDLLYQFFIFSLFIRLVSRSFEVFFAFLIDAVDGKNDSGLKSRDRIKLSITSYVELIILNAVVYFTVGEFKWKPDSGYHIIEGFMSAIATSVGVATFSDVNLTDNTNEVIQIVNIKYVMLLQLIVSFSLIVLNIAAYFSRDDNG